MPKMSPSPKPAGTARSRRAAAGRIALALAVAVPAAWAARAQAAPPRGDAPPAYVQRAPAGPAGNDTGTTPPRGTPQTSTPVPEARGRRQAIAARSSGLGPRVLAQGMSGEDVAAVQDWLTKRGYPVSSTGYFGPITDGRVRAFQGAHRLAADGVVGPRTLSAFGLYDPIASGGVVSDARSRPWLYAIPGTGGIRVDTRIHGDVEALIVRYDLRVTAAYAAGGHAAGGEHPLGLALDAVPADGNWARADQLASDLGWRSSCGSTGCAGRLPAPFRFIGYNGYPGHGDPAHAGSNAHIHLSWNHTPTAPNSRAYSVQRFRAP